MNDVQHMLLMYRSAYSLSVWVRETLFVIITWLKILGTGNSLSSLDSEGKVRGYWIPFFLCLSCTWPWPHRRDGSWGGAALWAFHGTVKLRNGCWTIQITPCKCTNRLWIRQGREDGSNTVMPSPDGFPERKEEQQCRKTARFETLLRYCLEQ